MSDRDSIIRKIQALLSKTIEAGATEHEALAAAEIASRLMAEHNLSFSDVDAARRHYADAAYGALYVERGRKHGSHVRWGAIYQCFRAVGRFTDTVPFTKGAAVAFYGTKDDAEIAHRICDLLQFAFDREWLAFSRTLLPGRRRSMRQSFEFGMAARINERLEALIAERAPQGTGREVMVLKNQVVRERFDEFAAGKMEQKRPRKVSLDASAYAQGREAGDRADLGQTKVRDTTNQRITG